MSLLLLLGNPDYEYVTPAVSDVLAPVTGVVRANYPNGRELGALLTGVVMATYPSGTEMSSNLSGVAAASSRITGFVNDTSRTAGLVGEGN